MRDGVPADRAGATLKPYDLALKTIIARQKDAATVKSGSRSRNNSLLVCLARAYAMPCLRNSSRGNSPAYRSPVTWLDTIGYQQRHEAMDHRIRRERRAGLANCIDDNPVLGLVRDCQREAVIGAAARMRESSVKVVCGRQHLAIVASAGSTISSATKPSTSVRNWRDTPRAISSLCNNSRPAPTRSHRLGSPARQAAVRACGRLYRVMVMRPGTPPRRLFLQTMPATCAPGVPCAASK